MLQSMRVYVCMGCFEWATLSPAPPPPPNVCWRDGGRPVTEGHLEWLMKRDTSSHRMCVSVLCSAYLKWKSKTIFCRILRFPLVDIPWLYLTINPTMWPQRPQTKISHLYFLKYKNLILSVALFLRCLLHVWHPSISKTGELTFGPPLWRVIEQFSH